MTSALKNRSKNSRLNGLFSFHGLFSTFQSSLKVNSVVVAVAAVQDGFVLKADFVQIVFHGYFLGSVFNKPRVISFESVSEAATKQASKSNDKNTVLTEKYVADMMIIAFKQLKSHGSVRGSLTSISNMHDKIS